ncbi:MAG TPA: tRNA (adenosine(37)-N6)-threonylcarbamoyltransferase complex dimerization subunit type 1 TsaB [Tepidisphaeraceae bacterium]|nr:tRNA (adenosine(37)-N6)-threonylcarbamoyltransferase complex dimerization subunit type 1 TsaB [Tepidisphaeraceae bacterium]
MPKAIAIETSGRVGSIALADQGRVLTECQFPHGLKHAAEIIPLIDRLCRAQEWTPRDIEELYVSAGPGSFTGLRIGITLAKTLAFANGVKLVAVPSVRVLVENAPAEAQQVIIVLDAKRDQIFTARFERSSEGWLEREAAHLDSLTAMLARSPRLVYLLGEGIPYHRKFVPEGDSSIVVTAEEFWRARAGAVAELGMGMAKRGEFADPYKLTPIYIRLPEAEEKRLAAEAKEREQGQAAT